MNWRGRYMHWTELAENTSDWPYAAEWNFYRRLVGRLLTEGHAGRWVVIKGESLIGFWDTLAEAETAARERALQPVLLKRILEWEPLIRLSLRAQGWHIPYEVSEAIKAELRRDSAA
jgi:hypothetical protein